MNCNYPCCPKNGSDHEDFLMASETAGVYGIGLTHYTCGARKMLLQDPLHPVTADLQVSPVGEPVDLGNGIYCQEFLLSGTVTYCPCGSCSPRLEYVSLTDSVLTTSATMPKLGIGTVQASPKPITYYASNGCGCCQMTKPCTNQIAITTSIEVTAGA